MRGVRFFIVYDPAQAQAMAPTMAACAPFVVNSREQMLNSTGWG
jgi:hypothetical protein